jgi:hypothetical protein
MSKDIFLFQNQSRTRVFRTSCGSAKMLFWSTPRHHSLDGRGGEDTRMRERKYGSMVHPTSNPVRGELTLLAQIISSPQFRARADLGLSNAPFRAPFHCFTPLWRDGTLRRVAGRPNCSEFRWRDGSFPFLKHSSERQACARPKGV